MTSRSSAIGRLPPTSSDEQPHGDQMLLAAAQQLRSMREERDAMRAALRDLVLGADMMLEPPVSAKSAFADYVREVKRVASAALSHQSPLAPTT